MPSKPDNGGLAFPRSMSEDPKDFGTALHFAQDGMSLRAWLVGHGPTTLPQTADDALWEYLTEGHQDSLEDAIAAYDAYMVQRDCRYADALIAELNKDTPDA